MHMPRVVIAGGTNPAGKALTRLLTQRGHRATMLPDAPDTHANGVEHIARGRFPAEAWRASLEGACGLIDLTAAAPRPDAAHAHRVTRALAKAMADCIDPPGVWLQASSLHVYGGKPRTRPADERMPAGDDALAQAWLAVEEAAREPQLDGVRRAAYRLGVVIGDGARTRQRMAALAHWAQTGPGARMDAPLSWIHAGDLARLLYWGLRMEIIAGPYNACVPKACRLEDLRHLAGRERPAWPHDRPAPEPLVLAAPRRFLDIAYQFRSEDLPALLAQTENVRPEAITQAEAALR